ncbi:hypothetical protein Golax_010169 [Gossypium laxum]|uniref:Uncharacterized protein n=1 Tax=Gossypium laxum TaxID=34288 RepID=A0A7J8ZGE5_9ROSI|nr:hypothetical protein [Gossypium laxum]
MAAPLLRKGIPPLHLRLQRHNLLVAGILLSTRRPWCTIVESARLEEEVSSTEKSSTVPSVKDPKKDVLWVRDEKSFWRRGKVLEGSGLVL